MFILVHRGQNRSISGSNRSRSSHISVDRSLSGMNLAFIGVRQRFYKIASEVDRNSSRWKEKLKFGVHRGPYCFSI